MLKAGVAVADSDLQHTLQALTLLDRSHCTTQQLHRIIFSVKLCLFFVFVFSCAVCEEVAAEREPRDKQNGASTLRGNRASKGWTDGAGQLLPWKDSRPRCRVMTHCVLELCQKPALLRSPAFCLLLRLSCICR